MPSCVLNIFLTLWNPVNPVQNGSTRLNLLKPAQIVVVVVVVIVVVVVVAVVVVVVVVVVVDDQETQSEYE